MEQARIHLAAASRDSYLALRRVERQQVLIERLHAARGTRLQLDRLAHDLRISARTLGRDVDRLRSSGVPIHTHRGRGGGVSIPRTGPLTPISFNLPEVAALISSLAVLGPSVSHSATSAMHKLATVLQPDGGQSSSRARRTDQSAPTKKVCGDRGKPSGHDGQAHRRRRLGIPKRRYGDHRRGLRCGHRS